MTDLRRLDTPAEAARASELFDAVWSEGALMPRNLVTALDHAGGYAFAAYDGDEMVAASVGFLAGTPAEPVLYSHITGVVDGRRGQGLGYAIKQHQREWSLARGIAAVVWTYDPLVRRNAAFNVAKLGARPVEYLTDFYGPMNDAINRGDETDRLLVEWDLNGTPRAEAGTVSVAVPDDVESLRRTDPEAAREWRYRVREELGGRMEEGWVVTGFDASGYRLAAPMS